MSLPLESTAPCDFDFVIGDWVVSHRKLKERLAGCTEWVAFDGTSSTRHVLGGFGNIEDNQLLLPEGVYRAVALRSYNTETRRWSIWWLDGRFPGALDTPVVGEFADGVGTFFAEDQLNGRPIRIRFTWSVPAPDQPRWEQAFSADDGVSWETNWTMQFTRRGGAPE